LWYSGLHMMCLQFCCAANSKASTTVSKLAPSDRPRVSHSRGLSWSGSGGAGAGETDGLSVGLSVAAGVGVGRSVGFGVVGRSVGFGVVGVDGHEGRSPKSQQLPVPHGATRSGLPRLVAKQYPTPQSSSGNVPDISLPRIFLRRDVIVCVRASMTRGDLQSRQLREPGRHLAREFVVLEEQACQRRELAKFGRNLAGQ